MPYEYNTYTQGKKGGTMTRHKKLTTEAKITSSLSKKINAMRGIIEGLKRTSSKYKEQMRLDHKFKQIIREKHKDIYWETVKEMK